jgi:hypothetical protein
MISLGVLLLFCAALCSADQKNNYGIRGNSLHDRTRDLQGYSVKFSLYNAVTDNLISLLQPGVIAKIGSISAGNLSIVANVTGPIPGSVKMSLTGAKSIERIEIGAPYALCGNIGRDLLSCSGLTAGNYTVIAVLYSKSGSVLFSANLDFAISQGSAPTLPQPTPIAPQPTPIAPQPTPIPPTSTPIAPQPAPAVPQPAPTVTAPTPPNSCSVPKVSKNK